MMMTINCVDVSVDLAYLDFAGMFDRKVVKTMMTKLMKNNQKREKKIFTLKIVSEANQIKTRLN